MSRTVYKVIGLMSGSSLDGLDLTYCEFRHENNIWSYVLLNADCYSYEDKWKVRLKNLVMQNAITYLKTHTYYGHYTAELINRFVQENQLKGKVDFIASHGQTIFHQPESMLTSQIGDGAAIAALTGIKVICDFRTTDIALGGQGAPIVGIAERELFSDYHFFLNLGGISNISCMLPDGNIIAYDISAANMVLNELSERLGHAYDEDGKAAASGQLNSSLLNELNDSWYFKKEPPKTLGGGWVRKVMNPIINKFGIPIEDKLCTFCEHIAMQIAQEAQLLKDKHFPQTENMKMLVTGGGAFNGFLMSRIKELCPVEVIIPDADVVAYKEAIAMGFLGVLRSRNEVNILASATGARKDNVGGKIFVPA